MTLIRKHLRIVLTNYGFNSVLGLISVSKTYFSPLTIMVRDEGDKFT